MKRVFTIAIIFVAAVQAAGQTVVTIGKGTDTDFRPLSSSWGYVRTVDLYLANEIGATGLITSIAWDKSKGSSSIPTPYKVYLKATGSTTVPTYDWEKLISDATFVSAGTFEITSESPEWYSIKLTKPFTLEKDENLLIMCVASAGKAGNGGSETFTGTEAKGMSGVGLSNEALLDVLEPHSTRMNVQLSFESLPVQLASFTARIEGGNVQMAWRTVSEVNNYGFHVQVRPSGEPSFADVPGLFIAGHGTTIEPQEYSCAIGHPGQGGAEYRLRQVDLDGSVHYSDVVRVGGVTGVEDAAPAGYFLAQNYPNPFNPSTIISYGVPKASHVRLTVFNALGAEVARPVDGVRPAGVYAVTFDADALASGVFYYRLQAGSHIETKRMVLLH